MRSTIQIERTKYCTRLLRMGNVLQELRLYEGRRGMVRMDGKPYSELTGGGSIAGEAIIRYCLYDAWACK
jgi:hypothetical protein